MLSKGVTKNSVAFFRRIRIVAVNNRLSNYLTQNLTFLILTRNKINCNFRELFNVLCVCIFERKISEQKNKLHRADRIKESLTFRLIRFAKKKAAENSFIDNSSKNDRKKICSEKIIDYVNELKQIMRRVCPLH